MTTVVLEGDEIDELLARVSSEHGPQARVVRAEKVRVGGVAGFFARQRFEVVVEVDDDAAGHEDEGPAADAADEEEDDVRARQQDGAGADARREEVLEDLFDSPIARALVRAQVLDDAVPPADAAERAGRAPDGAPRAASAGAPASGGMGALLDAADAEDAHRPGPTPVAGSGRHAVPSQPLEPGRPVSTESAAFAAVLDAVRDAAEPDAGLRGRTDERAADRVDERAAEAPVPHDAGAPAGGAARGGGDDVGPAAGPDPVPAGAAVAELMGLLAARHAAARAGGASPDQPPSADPSHDEPDRDEPGPEEPATEQGAGAAPQEAADGPAPVAATPVAATPAATPVVAASGSTPAGDDEGVRPRAAAAGLPPHLLDALPAGAGASDLREVLAALPAVPALPDGDGDLVVVVGAPRDALVVARSVASRLGLGPDGVVVAARPGGGVLRGEVVRDAAAARRAAATVRLGDAPGVVVVQADHDPDDVRWARHVVTALRADQVHAVVDATRKPTDTDRWFDAVLAGDPDAVHVVRAAGSADPGTVLGLDLPVAGVDGGPAGPDAWVGLLLREPVAPPVDAPVRTRRRRACAPGPR
ncbi:hypothetical protein WDZ17_02040 [Pseudokineococcus basanitobsidens]|uniref:Uncharacterized protein n=1 Tax=Pseudokineococcus basanitobsidens TaxID=1926649 RepID=A0ABU8RG89_9ACTN